MSRHRPGMFRRQNVRGDGKVSNSSAAKQASRKNPLPLGRWASQREQVESAPASLPKPSCATEEVQTARMGSLGRRWQEGCADLGADENLRVPQSVNAE